MHFAGKDHLVAATRGCAFLAADVEVVDLDHPAHPWLAAHTRLPLHRIHELAVGTGATHPDALAAELLLLDDGALAARARRAATAADDWPALTTTGALAAAAVARHVSRGAARTRAARWDALRDTSNGATRITGSRDCRTSR